MLFVMLFVMQCHRSAESRKYFISGAIFSKTRISPDFSEGPRSRRNYPGVR